MEEKISQKKSEKRALALIMAVVLLFSNSPWVKLTSVAEVKDYSISLVDGAGNPITAEKTELSIAMTSTDVSGGDAPGIVELQKQENGSWKANLDPERYQYQYNAGADGYQSASGSLSVSSGDAAISIKLMKNQQLTFMIPGTVKLNSGYDTYENAAIAESGQTVAYTSSNENVATVDETGKVTKKGSGSTTITASVAGNEIYTEASASYELIFQAESEIIMDTAEVFLNVGDTYSARQASTTRTDSPVITYDSSNRAIATVDENGVVTIAEELSEEAESVKVTITASVSESEDGIYQAAEKSYKITVSRKEQEALGYADSPAINMYVNQVHKHPANGGSGSGAVKYSSSNPDVATVDENGTVTAKSAGETTITIIKEADLQYKEQKLSYTIQVFDEIAGWESVCELGGNEKNSSGWYTGDVTLEAKAGYLLRRTDSGTWSDSLSVTDEGITAVTFYAKDENNNAITDALTATDIKLDTKVDKLSVALSAENKHLFNSAVQLKIEAEDSASGLSKISYTAKSGDVEFASGTCENVSGDMYTGTIMIPASVNGDVVVTVTSEDVAGNTKEVQSETFRINTMKPEISIEFTDIDGSFTRSNNADGRGYFTGAREAKIAITCDAQSFDEEAAKASVYTDAVSIEDDNGNLPAKDDITDSVAFSGWTKITDVTDSQTVIYEATIVFSGEGNYKWNPGYTDEAKNTNQPVTYNNSVTPVSFTIDNTLPEGNLKVEQVKIKDSATSDNLSNDTMIVSGTFSDAISPVYSVSYYKTSETGLTAEKLEVISAESWTNWTGEIKSGKDEQFVIYVRIEDYAGNVKYLSTDGIIVDCTSPTVSITTPDNNRGYYTGDVNVGIVVEDLGNVQTGIEEITYEVTKYDRNDTAAVIAQDTLYSASSEVYENKIEKSIAVKAENNDSNKVIITVTTKDRVGNERKVSKTIKIDTTKPAVTVTQPDPELALYNQDVQLTINAGDETSGLYRITYVASRADGTTFEGSVKETSGTAYEGTITIPADVNGDVTVKVTVEDVAGWQTQEEIAFRVNTDKPEISVDFGKDNFVREKEGRGYFRTGRTATVVITCDSKSFDAEAATKSILEQAIYATDSNGNEIKLQAVSITAWTTVKGANDFEDQHSATITFAQEGNYVWTPGYTDRAGNGNAQIQYKNSASPQRFTIDYTKPTGKVTAEDLGTWDGLPDSLHFGLTSNVTKQVSGGCEDVISPIYSFSYYKTSDSEAKTAEELDKITEWKDFQTFSSAENEQMVVYVRIEDYAGNVRYIGTNGMIFDNVLPNITISIPEGANGIHAGNVVTGITVEDPVAGSTAAGIQSVDYEVYNQGTLTMQGNLYQDSNETPSISDIIRRLNQSLTVLAEKNNSNNVEIRITVTDHAGNKRTISEMLRIDVTEPAISVNYDNNSGDTSFGDEVYFNSPRTATIQIRERNFDPGRVAISVTNVDGAVPSISKWSVTAADGNGDGAVHTATISFATDGKYTFHIGCMDMAGNVAPGADYGNSLAPTEFVVDTTLPTIDVVYDNTSFENENYYRESRTATVTIYEHNFDESRVTLNMEATDNGAAVPAAVLSGFRTSGDEHQATISFEQDALYSWSLEYTDMAGNVAESLETQSFYVDTTKPAITISGIRNHSANNDSGNIGFVLECHDTNFDVFTPVLTMVERDGDSFKVTEVEGSSTNIANGKQFTVENLPKDGIYSLKCTAVDKAGNAFDTVQLIDESGNTVTEERTAEQDLIQFSVNREGSAFGLDDFTERLVNNYYVQSVEQDVCILETNTDSLESYTVELNGERLEEGADYTVNLEHDENSWYLYTYRISNTLFEDEGEYNIVVQSVDKTETTAYSDVKNVNISFVVDKTPPIVTLSGLSSNGRYQTTEQSVTAIPTDDGGKVQSVRVLVLDSDGNLLKNDSGEDVSTRFEMAGEELDEYLIANNGQVLFTVPEGLYMTVQVICKDYAADSLGNTNQSIGEYTNITVSPSSFVIFLANKRLLFGIGSIAGAAVIGTTSFVMIRVKKKKAK